MNRIRFIFLTIGVVALSLSAAASNGSDDKDHKDHKVDVCHVPPGHPANCDTINVNESSVPSHLEHGDYLGHCRPTRSESR